MLSTKQTDTRAKRYKFSTLYSPLRINGMSVTMRNIAAPQVSFGTSVVLVASSTICLYSSSGSDISASVGAGSSPFGVTSLKPVSEHKPVREHALPMDKLQQCV